MGIEYTITLSNPAKIKYLIKTSLSKKKLSRAELKDLFIKFDVNMPVYLEEEIEGKPAESPAFYDEFIIELISEKQIELYKSGCFLYSMTEIDRKIDEILVPFILTKNEEIDLSSIKGVSDSFNLRIYDVSGLKSIMGFVNDLKNKNFLTEFLSKKIDRKKRRITSNIFGNKNNYLETLSALSDKNTWETWIKYLDALLYALEKELYLGMYY